MKNLLFEKVEEITKENNITLEEIIEQQELFKDQIKFIKTDLGQAINGGIDIALKSLLPDFIEDEIIAVKNSLLTEGFSAALDTAIEEITNLGNNLKGIATGSFENISQIKEVVENGGLIDTISDLLDTGIDWAKKEGYVSKSVASSLKKGKNTIMNTIEDEIGETLENQVVAIKQDHLAVITERL